MRISGSWHAGLRIRQNGPDVQFKPLYEAIGEPNNRHRKPASLGRMVERFMLLDAVLADTHYSWLGFHKNNLASPMPASWNQIASWLKQIDNFRQAA